MDADNSLIWKKIEASACDCILEVIVKRKRNHFHDGDSSLQKFRISNMFGDINHFKSVATYI